MERYLLATDTPGIKQFVFGTDALAEIRGASALLDRFNRVETERLLRDNLPKNARLTVVYTNGGTGQFVIHADRSDVERAIEALAREYREATGDDARIVWGLVPWPESDRYSDAVSSAHLQMRMWRETNSANRCSPLFPLMHECSSSSHLPSETKPYCWGKAESALVSVSTASKLNESRMRGRTGIWPGWMEYLKQRGEWPDEDRWPRLRPQGADDFKKSRKSVRPIARQGYVGLVYADGNAMGRFVQETDSPETCQAFSSIVEQRDGTARTRDGLSGNLPGIQFHRR